MPALPTTPPFDPESTPTHAKGRWFWAALVGVWPLALVATLIGGAFGLPLGIALGSSLAVALAADFVVVVMTLAIDDGDIQRRWEDR